MFRILTTADLLESLDRDWRYVTSFASFPAYFEIRRAVPTDLKVWWLAGLLDPSEQIQGFIFLVGYRLDSILYAGHPHMLFALQHTPGG